METYLIKVKASKDERELAGKSTLSIAEFFDELDELGLELKVVSKLTHLCSIIVEMDNEMLGKVRSFSTVEHIAVNCGASK